MATPLLIPPRPIIILPPVTHPGNGGGEVIPLWVGIAIIVAVFALIIYVVYDVYKMTR